jgi:hypothetical protein
MTSDFDSRILQFLKNLFGLLQERLAGRSEFDPAPGSDQELCSQLVLQIFDALTQRRLGNA